MRNTFIIIFSVMMLFTSSCAMKKVVLRYLDVQKAVPAKALPSASHSHASFDELCSINVKTGSILDDVELASMPDGFHMKVPVFFLLATFLFSWIILQLIPSSASDYSRQHSTSFSSVPIYLRIRQLVYYA